MSVSRRLAAAGAAAALSLTGIAVVSPAVAMAAECSTSASRTFEDTLIDYTISQEVVGSAEVAPGGNVTYLTKVSSDSAVGGLITSITDHHPAGFTLVKAELDASDALGNRFTSDETAGAVKNASAGTVTVSGAGWTTATTIGGGYVGLYTTYTVPESAVPGETLASGADITLKKIIGERNEAFDPSGVCVTVREKNPVEEVTGSLGDLGFGSAAGDSALSMAITDPQDFIAGIINQIDLGEMLGLS